MATPRQKKRETEEDGGYVRAATARGFSDKSRLYADGGVPATPESLAGERTASGCARDSHTSEPLRSRISKTIDFILEGTQALQHFGINAVQTI